MIAIGKRSNLYIQAFFSPPTYALMNTIRTNTPSGRAQQASPHGPLHQIRSNVSQIITARWSIYQYLPDGRTQRFKSVEQKLYPPQNAIVFIPDYETLKRVASQPGVRFDMASTLGENELQMLQILLEYVYRTTGRVYICTHAGDKLEHNSDIANHPGQIFLAFGDEKKSHMDFYFPVSKEPKIGYHPFDTSKYPHPHNPQEHIRERHIGNKIVSIIRA